MFTRDYLAEHVHYGYAVTVHASQGATAGDALTAGAAHAILSDRATRNLAYVALTRGRDANHVYLYDTTDGEADHAHTELANHKVHAPRRGTSRDAATALRAILGRDEHAHTMIQAAADTDRHLLPPKAARLVARHEHIHASYAADC